MGLVLLAWALAQGHGCVGFRDKWHGEREIQLTLVLLRSPLVPSIQMYSARHLPRWSSFMYFESCVRYGQFCAMKVGEWGERMLTLEELDTMVDSPTPACRR